MLITLLLKPYFSLNKNSNLISFLTLRRPYVFLATGVIHGLKYSWIDHVNLEQYHAVGYKWDLILGLSILFRILQETRTGTLLFFTN